MNLELLFILLTLHNSIVRNRDTEKHDSVNVAYAKFWETFLQPLMRIRVPNTLGNVAVRKFIEKTLSTLGWEVVIDRFSEMTPLGLKHFTNVVATKDPTAPRRLVLACHYDSKYFPDDSPVMFVGATDSAVPCAIMLHIATMASKLVTKNITIQLLFFDGEEAFVSWSDKDSLYGSRHLSDIMGNLTLKKYGYPHTTLLESMDIFILLDLIGAKDPKFYCIIPQTCMYIERLAVIENELADSGMLYGEVARHINYFCPPSAGCSHLSDTVLIDDHIPFKNKGVATLPLVSIPFPEVWHTYSDDETAIDSVTLMNIVKILEVFVEKYVNHT